MDRSDSQIIRMWETVTKAWPICVYLPSLKQDQFHRSKAMSVVLSGGNQSGKTHAGLCEVIAWLLGFRPWLHPDDPDFFVLNGKGNRIAFPNTIKICTTDYPNGLMQAIWPKWNDLLPKEWFRSRKNNQGFPTEIECRWGSMAYVMSYDQDSKKYESGTFHGIQYDEPPPRDVMIASRRGLMRHAGRELFTMTPISEAYLVTELYEQANKDGTSIEVIHITTEDNLEENGGVLDRASFERFTSTQTDIEKALRTAGDTAVLSGRVMKNFHHTEPWVIEAFDIPPDWYRVCILDTHERKPDFVLWWAMCPRTRREVIYDEVFDETTQDTYETTAGTIKLHEAHSGGTPVVRLIDPRAASKHVRSGPVVKTVAQELEDYGIITEPAPGIDIKSGFKRVNGKFKLNPLTGLPGVQVFITCIHLVSELRSLNWAMKKLEYAKQSLTVGRDDGTSCMRYLYTWGPHVGKLETLRDQEIISPPDADVEALVMGGDTAGYSDGTHTGY